MDNSRFEAGLATRKEVLGEAYVEASLQAAGAAGFPLQKLTTEFCWDAIWNRPGLSRRDRSILNLGMLAALNRPHELRLHLDGALTNGVTVEEIHEIILQVTFYCGGPAALDLNRAAQEVFRARGLDQDLTDRPAP